MPAYANLAELKAYTGLETEVVQQDQFLTAMLVRASQRIDTWTRTFWDKRTLVVTTEATSDHQQRLFMPAHILSIASVTQGGIALATEDFYAYATWLELEGRLPWSNLQQDIVVAGDFGFKTVPDDVKLATLEIASILSGIKTKTMITDEGVERTVTLTTMPGWVREIVAARRLVEFVAQPWIISGL